MTVSFFVCVKYISAFIILCQVYEGCTVEEIWQFDLLNLYNNDFEVLFTKLARIGEMKLAVSPIAPKCVGRDDIEKEICIGNGVLIKESIGLPLAICCLSSQ